MLSPFGDDKVRHGHGATHITRFFTNDYRPGGPDSGSAATLIGSSLSGTNEQSPIAGEALSEGLFLVADPRDEE
jgi:hypothetical protein